MNKFSLATVILQLISGLVLIGISIYYYTADKKLNCVIFLVVGIIFVVRPIYTLCKQGRSKNDENGADGDGKNS